MYNDYRMNDENVQDYQKQEDIIKTVSKRFKTYGYKRIKTSAFEQYDLYSKVNSSINQNEMIKVIDYTGEVLVLRPDVTLPITRKLAQAFTTLPSELRYFYVQDVFRQPMDRLESIENTQAGVEYFCESSPEADAEVIALAIDTLKDLGFQDVKIEIGHAGFFQEMIDLMDLAADDLSDLKSLIKAKNVVDIDPFLRGLSIEKNVREAVERIPFLYGNPIDVSERAREITLTNKMNEKLDYLVQVFNIIQMYGLEDHIVLDLGLINHMGYYSDVIFQGFIEKFGKPVLMGGRYNQLGDAFGANIPAIGFACEVDSLIEATKSQLPMNSLLLDIKVCYEKAYISQSIEVAGELRNRNYSVIALPKQKKSVDQQDAIFTITIEESGYCIRYKGSEKSFFNIEEVVTFIESVKEESDWTI